MNQLVFEGRCLMGLVGGIMRQEDLRILYQRMNWDRMYRLADYHHIVPIVYLGILGHGKDIPARCRDRFFARYGQYLEFTEHWEEAEAEVLNLYHMRGIFCTVLSTNQIRRLYPIGEAAGIHSLTLLLEKEDYALAKGFLVDLGYERQEFLEESGERFKGTGGLLVDLYWEMPFKPAYYRREAQRILKRARPVREGAMIFQLSTEDTLLLSLFWAVYRYAINTLTVQELLDLYVLHRSWWKSAQREIEEEGEGFKISGFGRKLLVFSYLWFGAKDDAYLREQSLAENGEREYDVLEKRLLTRGMIQTEIDPEMLSLQDAIQKEEERRARKEKRRKMRAKVAAAIKERKERFLSLKAVRRLRRLAGR